MEVKIDKNRCVGCGLCVSIASDVFELEEVGKSKIKEDADLKKIKS